MFSMGEMTVSMWGCIISTPELSWAELWHQRTCHKNLSSTPSLLVSLLSLSPHGVSGKYLRNNVVFPTAVWVSREPLSDGNDGFIKSPPRVILCYIFLPPLLCSPPCIISVSAQVRLFIHCACQFAHFLSASFSQTRTKYFSIILPKHFY